TTARAIECAAASSSPADASAASAGAVPGEAAPGPEQSAPAPGQPAPAPGQAAPAPSTPATDVPELPGRQGEPGAPPSAAPLRTVAVIDMGASAIRLVVAEVASEGTIRILEEASRGVLLGKDTFTHGRITASTMEAALRVLSGFRRIMNGYGVERCRAVATSAVREAANRDNFLDRVRLRSGIEAEV